MRAFTIHASPPSLFTLTMVYLSSFSGPSLPSLMPHQRPLIVALVSVAWNFASSSSWLSFGFAGAGLDSWAEAGAAAARSRAAKWRGRGGVFILMQMSVLVEAVQKVHAL